MDCFDIQDYCEGIDIEIDELTDCIYDRQNGERFDTEYSLLEEKITKLQADRMKGEGWRFDWSKPQNDGFCVYKLTIKGDKEIQGLIALKHIPNQYYTFVSLVEANPLNVGKERGRYIGTGANLFAIACKLSFEAGNEGYVQFEAKTDLVQHYIETLGAIPINKQLMYLDTNASAILVNTYMKEE